MTSTKTARIGQLWTDSVAYVALLTGAGLSIAGNVANVLRTRGAATDMLDIVLAVAFPALVVLMVEVFVSSRWRGLTWPMQILRWLGCLSIGAVAMRVSWVHLNELMSNRGQTADVATLGPLAIDFLAIMATALILAGRGQVRVQPVQVDTSAVQAPVQVDSAVDRWPAAWPASAVQDVLPEDEASGIADEASVWLALQDRVLDSTTTPAHPITTVSLSNQVKPESVPADAADLIRAWIDADPSERPAAGVADRLVAAALSRDARTARRWRTAVVASAANGWTLSSEAP
jgi:hypothetical protein